jgi:DNA excision repair protein ERCC-5
LIVGSGIGIVNAIEVVNAFDEEDGLKTFKEMVESVDLSLLGLEGRGSKRKGSQGKAKGEGKNGGTDDMGEKDDTNEGSESAGNGDGPGRALRQEAFMESHVRWRQSSSAPCF